MKISNLLLADLWAELTDGSTLFLDGASIRLFTNTPTIDDDTALADFVVPTFTSYADASADEWVVAAKPDGTLYLSAPVASFQPTNSANLPEAITGAVIYKGADWWAAGLFAAPLNLVMPLQLLHVTAKLSLVGDAGMVMEGYIE